MDLSEYRNSLREQERVSDLLALLPDRLESALDIGARDGFISRLLADRSSRVTALDLTLPAIPDSRIECVQGNLMNLQFPDGAFELVFCAEVLEHIPPTSLRQACLELARVSERYIMVGVPYKQDIRLGRTICRSCGQTNPPWGHVNSFDEKRLASLFPTCRIAKRSFVGVAEMGTNWLAALLMDAAGNPYGTYSQEEPCVHCNAPLHRPPQRTLLQKIFTRLGLYAREAQKPFFKPHPNWIHLLFEKIN